jgi:hypothetical protein
MTIKIIKNLKGGSLSKTIVIKKNNKKYVRKLVDIENNREYGFYRWFSQFKKLQRLNAIFPSIFPKVLSSGIMDKYYYFDIKYFDNSQNCYEYLSNEKNEKKIVLLLNKIVNNLKKINEVYYPSILGSQNIYFKEEIKRRINLFKIDKKGKNFLKHKFYYLNGHSIKNSINKILSWLDNNMLNFALTRECYTHGNLTLENILYKPKSKKVIFIDPYEENFVDSQYQEISQLLQSCNSNYEVLCKAKLNVKKNIIKSDFTIPKGIKIFNENLDKFIKEKYTNNEIKIIKFYEMAQFIRMLPFKLKGNSESAKLFLVIAMKIFNEELDV